MGNKYYAVRVGYKTGIFTDWNTCSQAVTKYKGAEYKSFKTQAEAESYLQCNDVSVNKCPVERPVSKDVANLFVDGSFKDGVIGYGVYMQTALQDYKFIGCTNRCSDVTMRNIVGELVATASGVQVARELGYHKVNIIYDYQGIESWFMGNWSCKNNLALLYNNLLHRLQTQGMQYRFIKIAGYKGVTGNEIADKLARQAIAERVYADFDDILRGISVRVPLTHFVR